MRNRTEDKIELYLIRHGATEYNLSGRYLGCRTDAELSDYGKQALLSNRLFFEEKGLKGNKLFCGPMLRCRQTADIIFPHNNDLIIVDEWTEIDFGAFEGKNYKELSGNEDYQRWIDSGGTIAFPEGEAREAFIERSSRGLDKAIKLFDEASTNIAILHGGNIMSIMSCLRGGEYFDYQLKPGEMYHCILTKDNISESDYFIRSFEKIDW